MAQNYRYRGHKIQVLESLLTHSTHSDGLVNSCDPVNVGLLVGVSLLSAEAATDYITIATDGVFDLLVHGVDSSTSSAVSIGDRIYIENGLLDKDSGHTPFGIALGAVVAHAQTTIPVKVCGAGN